MVFSCGSTLDLIPVEMTLMLIRFVWVLMCAPRSQIGKNLQGYITTIPAHLYTAPDWRLCRVLSCPALIEIKLMLIRVVSTKILIFSYIIHGMVFQVSCHMFLYLEDVYPYGLSFTCRPNTSLRLQDLYVLYPFVTCQCQCILYQ